MELSTTAAAFLPEFDKDRVYLDFYDLKEVPFSITPDPEFIFLSHTHQVVIDKILYGIKTRMGFIILSGEVGTGKTTICRSILDSLDGSAETVYIINPSLSGKEIISGILDDLGINCPPDSSKKDLIALLNRFLLSHSDADAGPVVIIIDDAQTISIEALEDLRLLSNLETDKNKLLQVVLVGQPELLDLVSRPEMRQLKQRVSINCHLEYLAKTEVEGYLLRRLFVAGDKGRIRFTPGAVKLIFNASNGTPRLINKICDYALTAGYIENDFTIGSTHVKKALKELGELDFKNDNYLIKKSDQTGNKVNRSTFFLISIVLILTGFLLIQNFYNPIPAPNKNKVEAAAESNRRLTNKITDEKPDAITGEKKEVYRQEADGLMPGTDGKTEGTALQPESIIDNEKLSLYPYALQLGSFKTLDRTIKAVSIYKNKGIEANWQLVDAGKRGKWYRLFTGRFKKKGDAVEYKARLKLYKSIVKFAPWTVSAWQGSSVEDLDKALTLLRENLYNAHIVKKSDPAYSLQVGIFSTRKKTEEVVRELSNTGLFAVAVPR